MEHCRLLWLDLDGFGCQCWRETQGWDQEKSSFKQNRRFRLSSHWDIDVDWIQSLIDFWAIHDQTETAFQWSENNARHRLHVKLIHLIDLLHFIFIFCSALVSQKWVLHWQRFSKTPNLVASTGKWLISIWRPVIRLSTFTRRSNLWTSMTATLTLKTSKWFWLSQRFDAR